MGLCDKTEKVLNEFNLKKKTAERFFDRMLLEALHGNMNQEALGIAMERCNEADYAIIEFERMNSMIKRGEVMHDTDEFYRLYIKPYEQSKAP